MATYDENIAAPDEDEKVTAATFKRYEDAHQEALERFKQAADAEKENREAARDDIRFRKGDHWTPRDKQSRKGRPTLSIPRINDFPRRVVNEMRRNRPAISVAPADSKASPEVATIYAGLIRNVERVSRADVAYETAFDQAVGNGFGHWQIVTEYVDENSFVQEARIKRIPNPFSVYSDPLATEPDWFDAKWRLVTEWMPSAEFERKHGFKPTSADLGKGDPGHLWFNGDQVQVAQYWVIDYDETTIYLMPDGTIIEGRGKAEGGPAADRELFAAAAVKPVRDRRVRKPRACPYLVCGQGAFKKSKYLGAYIPIVSVVGEELWDEEERVIKSLIRDAKDSQRSYDYWASLETELVSQQPKAPWILPKGAIDDPELRKKWDSMNHKAHPYLEFDASLGMAPSRGSPPQFPDAIRAGMMRCEDDMRAIMGMPQATQGMVSGEQSGIAVFQRKLQGDIGTYHFMANMRRALRNTGVILVDLLPKLLDKPRVARIVNVDGTPTNVPVNQPYIDPADGLQKFYDVHAGRYDVAIDEGPSYQSQREQQIASQIELSKVAPSLLQVAGDLIIEAMPWTNAKEIAKRIKASMPPELVGGLPRAVQAQIEQGKQMLQQSQQEIEKLQNYIREQQFDVQKKALEASSREATAEVQRARLELDRQRLEWERSEMVGKSAVDRMQATADLLSAQVDMVQAVADAAGIALDASHTLAGLQAIRGQISEISRLGAGAVQLASTSDPNAPGQRERSPAREGPAE